MNPPTTDQLRDALERLLQHLGDMPHEWPSHPLFRAYCDANSLLHPDEFTERFMASATKEKA
jgi:hypothetical protein